MFADREVESCNPCNDQVLGHTRSDMLKSYFVEHILLTFLKYVFFLKKKKIYVVKSNYFKITPLPTSVFHIPNNYYA